MWTEREAQSSQFKLRISSHTVQQASRGLSIFVSRACAYERFSVSLSLLSFFLFVFLRPLRLFSIVFELLVVVLV